MLNYGKSKKLHVLYFFINQPLKKHKQKQKQKKEREEEERKKGKKTQQLN